jgi:hypothetical protein
MQYGETSLMCAAQNGHVDCTRLLLDAGADTSVHSHVRVDHLITEYISYDHRARVYSAFVVCLKCFLQLDAIVRDLMNTFADRAFVRDVVPGEIHDCVRPCNGLRQRRRCATDRGSLCRRA